MGFGGVFWVLFVAADKKYPAGGITKKTDYSVTLLLATAFHTFFF